MVFCLYSHAVQLINCFLNTSTVTLHSFSGNTFRGFLIQLYSELDDRIVGNQLTAYQNSTSIKPHACVPSTGGFTHTNRDTKNSIEFQWTPLTGTGFVFFRFVIIREICWEVHNVYYELNCNGGSVMNFIL